MARQQHPVEADSETLYRLNETYGIGYWPNLEDISGQTRHTSGSASSNNNIVSGLFDWARNISDSSNQWWLLSWDPWAVGHYHSELTFGIYLQLKTQVPGRSNPTIWNVNGSQHEIGIKETTNLPFIKLTYTDSSTQEVTGLTSLTIDEWAHVGIVVKTNQIEIWLNGVLDNYATKDSGKTIQQAGGTIYLCVGAFQTKKQPPIYLDEFAIYSTAKDQTWFETYITDIPVADFYSENGTVGIDSFGAIFIDNSTSNPTSWLWDFGDGTTSTEQHPYHEFVGGGYYTVSLTVTNKYGSNTLTMENLITVRQAKFSADILSGIIPLTVSFTDESVFDYDMPLENKSWLWDFGDGETSTEQNPIHIYTTDGSFTVSLTITGTIL
jgi:PKD repeat protein